MNSSTTQIAESTHNPHSAGSEIELEPKNLRKLLGNYPTGVAIVTTIASDGRLVGLTINSFASLSLTPPLVLWSLVSQSSNVEVFQQCPHFTINILSQGQEESAKRFATSSIQDKFDGAQVHYSPEGLPLIAGALATIVCERDQCMEVGDHQLIIGKIVRASYTENTPLVFHAGQFASLAEVA